MNMGGDARKKFANENRNLDEMSCMKRECWGSCFFMNPMGRYGNEIKEYAVFHLMFCSLFFWNDVECVGR